MNIDKAVQAAGDLHGQLAAVRREAALWPQESPDVRLDLMRAGRACRLLLTRVEPAVAFLEKPPNDGKEPK